MATVLVPQKLSSPTEFIFNVKLSWDDRHQAHTSLLWKLGFHTNHSDISITPLSYIVLSSYLVQLFLGMLSGDPEDSD